MAWTKWCHQYIAINLLLEIFINTIPGGSTGMSFSIAFLLFFLSLKKHRPSVWTKRCILPCAVWIIALTNTMNTWNFANYESSAQTISFASIFCFFLLYSFAITFRVLLSAQLALLVLVDEKSQLKNVAWKNSLREYRENLKWIRFRMLEVSKLNKH